MQKCESCKIRTCTGVVLSFLEGNETHLTAKNDLDKVVIVGESNDAGVWRRSPQPPEAKGGLEAETIFTKFF